jgi:acetylornithine/succinyldiaminopimelate/putrescine aminotransferase
VTRWTDHSPAAIIPRREALYPTGLGERHIYDATIRLAPPLVISEDELEWALERILGVRVDAGSR